MAEDHLFLAVLDCVLVPSGQGVPALPLTVESKYAARGDM